jgi:uncharacterized protein YggE
VGDTAEYTDGVRLGAGSAGVVLLGDLFDRRPTMSDEIRRSMSVSAVGRVAAPPDVLAVVLAVETEAPTVSQALSENSTRANDMMSALKEHGVDERDLQTSQFTIAPVWEPRGPNDTRPAKIIGYRVRNALRAKVRDLQGAGATIDAAVRAGGDASRLQDISYSIDNPGKLLVQAREAAVEEAKAKAKQLTEGLGVRLGGVISISESVVGEPRPFPDFAQMAREAPPVIAAGEEEVAVQVTVDYELVHEE